MAENKIKITVQVALGHDANVEYREVVANVTADTPQQAVDMLAQIQKPEYRYRYLGDNGFIAPSGRAEKANVYA